LGSVEFFNFADDTTSITLGVGRQFNERWSGSISIGHEDASVRPSTTALAPTTGFTSVSLGARYRGDAFTVSGGISYIDLGDQLVNSAAGQANFDDNEAIAIGFQIGYSF